MTALAFAILRFGIFTRIILWPTGAEPGLLAECGDREVNQLKLVGLLMWLIWCTQSIVYSAIAAEMFGIALNPAVLAGGVLIATFILLSDSALVMHGSFWRQGVAALKLGGYPIENSLGSRIQGGFVIALRLAVAAANSVLTTGLIGLLIFGADIKEVLHRDNVAANALILESVTASFDGALEDNASIQAALRERITTAVKEEATLRAAAIDPTVNDPVVRLQLDLLVRLADAKAAADRDVATAQDMASRELAGEKGNGLSGVAGYGPMRVAADERVANTSVRAEQAAHELEAAQARLEEMQGSMSAATAAKRDEAKLRLAELVRDRQAAEATLAKLDGEHRTLSANRAAAIRQAMESNPAFIPMENGLLAKAAALSDLMGNLHVAALVIVMDIVFLTFEISAVMARILPGTPSDYATRLVQRAYLRSRQAAEETDAQVRAGFAGTDGDAGGSNGDDPDDGGDGNGGAPVAPSPSPPDRDPPGGGGAVTGVGSKDGSSALPGLPLMPIARFTAERDARERAAGDALAPSVDGPAATALVKRGRGRPPGSRNKTPFVTIDGQVTPNPESSDPTGDQSADDHKSGEGQSDV